MFSSSTLAAHRHCAALLAEPVAFSVSPEDRDFPTHPHIRQLTRAGSGIASLQSALSHYRKASPGQKALAIWLADRAPGGVGTGGEEFDIESLAWAARQFGLQAEVLEFAELADLQQRLSQGETLIVHWNRDREHYSVVDGIGDGWIQLMDPQEAVPGKRHPFWYFLPRWRSGGAFTGWVLSLTPAVD